MTIEAMDAPAAKHHRKPMVAHVHATELDRTEFHPNEWIYQRERYGFAGNAYSGPVATNYVIC